ncbi:hypothetical protein CF319_g5022 [Tilletia indica]|uniref:Uncharacterized protein n=1 Tax=Tilletia indica TaxID=43049 RepID=A0A177TEE1_9BASI|nr:hypothetical protein CF319_g5022 [Tilletia indica]KAE8250759.1 hypothetical protein A4X13_0g4414 [Tilletia indica]
MSAGRFVKWTTHLAITTDAVLGAATSKEFLHEIDTTIFDPNDMSFNGKAIIWARVAPTEGAYLLNLVPMATKPFRLAINEPNAMRQIPEDFDGTDPSNASLPPFIPYLSGVGLLKSVAEDKKHGVIAGFTFLGKSTGWAQWEIEVAFEDHPRWALWSLPPPRSVVAFDASLAEVTDNGDLKCYLRRISTIDTNVRPLLAALGVGHGPTAANDRVAKLKEIRAQAAMKGKTEASADNGSQDRTSETATKVNTQDTADATNKVDPQDNVDTAGKGGTQDNPDVPGAETPFKIQANKTPNISAPAAPRTARNGHVLEDPPSPSPTPSSRKRKCGGLI